MLHNREIMKLMWLPKYYVNTTSSGLNENTLVRRRINTSDLPQEYIEYELIPSMKNKKAKESTAPTKFLRSKKDNYYVDIVNNCLESLYKNDEGFVFNVSQLYEVYKRIENIHIVHCENIFYITVKKENNKVGRKTKN